MNEDAINDGYEYFVQTGYPGTIDDYKTLMETLLMIHINILFRRDIKELLMTL